MQEGIDIFAGLADEYLAAAGSAAAADRGQLAADHCGKVDAGRKQDLREHGGRGGLAVRTGDADCVRIPLRYKSEQLAALHHFDAGSLRCGALRIGLCDRRRIDDQIGTLDILRTLTELHRDSQCAHRRERIGLVVIRAGQVIPFRMKHLCQRIHSAAADADHMDMLFTL